MAKSKPKLTVHAALVCEDIRTEITGKEILIGVYPSEINVPAIPFNLMLCIWIQWSASITSDIPFQLRMYGPNRINLFEGGGNIVFNSPGRMGTFVIGGVRFQVQAAGEFLVEIKEADHPWRRLICLPVTVGQPPPALAPGAITSQVASQGQEES